MSTLPLVKAHGGQTVPKAQRAADDQLVVEDLVALEPGDVITLDGREMVVVHAEANPRAPGPHGPVPQTRGTFRPAGTASASSRA